MTTTRTDRTDIRILRDLAKQYAELAAKPVQQERRKLWAAHFSLKKTRPPVIATYGMWNVWCREVFGERALKCVDPLFRAYEQNLRMAVFHDSIGDDFILEPWITQRARFKTPGGIFGEQWGVRISRSNSGVEGGAWKPDPLIKDWKDAARLVAPHHIVDEERTRADTDRLRDAIGGIVEIDAARGPIMIGFAGDISTSLAALRGLEQIMLDMYESPDELKTLLTFMRDGILRNQQEAEDAGDFSLASHENQSMPYAEELEWPRANSGPRKRKDLWGFCAAQEFTLISPEFHDEFLFRYQMPIMEKYGLVHYGCCEDLTRKIGMLRQLKNLRSIAVSPVADLKGSAERIGTDYAISWRPNPTDMVCAGWDENRIRGIVGEAVSICRDQHMHIHLKDVETVQGDPSRLARWTRLVREVIDAT